MTSIESDSQFHPFVVSNHREEIPRFLIARVSPYRLGSSSIGWVESGGGMQDR